MRGPASPRPGSAARAGGGTGGGARRTSSRAVPRRARLVWYGLGVLAATVLASRWVAPAFVPAPGGQRPLPQHEAQSVDGAAAAAATAAVMLLAPAEALAKEGKWGVLESKTSSLVHPTLMASLFLTTLYTGFLGWQWRRTRLIAGDISALRKELPKEPKAEDPEAAPSAHVKELKDQIATLSDERSELVNGKYKDRHYQISALLMGGGIFFTFYGVFNTWFRAEKLFPGPHLFAGAAIVVLWALAGACVPFMEKGNDTARTAHIGFNVVSFGLFAWQLPTGFEITQKVWGNAKLPWF